VSGQPPAVIFRAQGTTHTADRTLQQRLGMPGTAYSELTRTGTSPMPVMAGRSARKALIGNWLAPSMVSSAGS